MLVFLEWIFRSEVSRTETAKQLLVKATFLGVADINANKKRDKVLQHVSCQTFIRLTSLHGPIRPSTVSVPAATYEGRL